MDRTQHKNRLELLVEFMANSEQKTKERDSYVPVGEKISEFVHVHSSKGEMKWQHFAALCSVCFVLIAYAEYLEMVLIGLLTKKFKIQAHTKKFLNK